MVNGRNRLTIDTSFADRSLLRLQYQSVFTSRPAPGLLESIRLSTSSRGEVISAGRFPFRQSGTNLRPEPALSLLRREAAAARDQRCLLQSSARLPHLHRLQYCSSNMIRHPVGGLSFSVDRADRSAAFVFMNSGRQSMYLPVLPPVSPPPEHFDQQPLCLPHRLGTLRPPAFSSCSSGDDVLPGGTPARNIISYA